MSSYEMSRDTDQSKPSTLPTGKEGNDEDT